MKHFVCGLNTKAVSCGVHSSESDFRLHFLLMNYKCQVAVFVLFSSVSFPSCS